MLSVEGPKLLKESIRLLLVPIQELMSPAQHLQLPHLQSSQTPRHRNHRHQNHRDRQYCLPRVGHHQNCHDAEPLEVLFAAFHGGGEVTRGSHGATMPTCAVALLVQSRLPFHDAFLVPIQEVLHGSYHLAHKTSRPDTSSFLPVTSHI